MVAGPHPQYIKNPITAERQQRLQLASSDFVTAPISLSLSLSLMAERSESQPRAITSWPEMGNQEALDWFEEWIYRNPDASPMVIENSAPGAGHANGSLSHSSGGQLSVVCELNGHRGAVTGIVLPPGSDKLYTVSKGGTFGVWDCKSWKSVDLKHPGIEFGSLMSEGDWLFVGMPHCVAAWNVRTSTECKLTVPAGRQVYAMVAANRMLFAGVQNGDILAWKFDSENNSFQMVESLKGHSHDVVSLAVGSNVLYSGSKDHTIRVWDINTLQCKQTLNEHTAPVMSLLYREGQLLSGSLDQTIKAWDTRNDSSLRVEQTHDEACGVLALCRTYDAEAKPILVCSCTENPVRLYEFPSFTRRDMQFESQEVGVIIGARDLLFTGDVTGKVIVWKWLGDQSGGGFMSNTISAQSTTTI